MKPEWKSDLIYRELSSDYTPNAIENRVNWLESTTSTQYQNTSKHCLDPAQLKGNIENMIGATQIPLGIAGPIEIRGEHTQGKYYVPMATTEGALVKSYTRGMIALGHSQGVKTRILKNTIHVTPMFYMDELEDLFEMKDWIEDNFHRIKQIAEAETSHGELQKIEVIVQPQTLLLKLSFDSKDAMGLNMINIAASNVCLYLCSKFPVQKSIVRSNFSSDKKANHANLISGYGKELLAEATLPKRIVRKFFRVDPEEFVDYCYRCGQIAMQTGMMGLNGHYANGLAAIFIATGQDPARVVNSSAGTTTFKLTPTGDLYAACKIHNLLVGTVGGGTGLATQKEALKMMDCYGPGKVNKFAEIIAGTLVAGELSITAALLSQDFVNAHRKRHHFTRTLQ